MDTARTKVRPARRSSRGAQSEEPRAEPPSGGAAAAGAFPGQHLLAAAVRSHCRTRSARAAAIAAASAAASPAPTPAHAPPRAHIPLRHRRGAGAGRPGGPGRGQKVLPHCRGGVWRRYRDPGEALARVTLARGPALGASVRELSRRPAARRTWREQAACAGPSGRAAACCGRAAVADCSGSSSWQALRDRSAPPTPCRRRRPGHLGAL